MGLGSLHSCPDRSEPQPLKLIVFVFSQREARSRQAGLEEPQEAAPGSAPELQALPSSESPDRRPRPDFASAFRQEEQEAAGRQGGACVWSRPFPSALAPCHMPLIGELDHIQVPATQEAGTWGCLAQNPGAVVGGGRRTASSEGPGGLWHLLGRPPWPLHSRVAQPATPRGRAGPPAPPAWALAP